MAIYKEPKKPKLFEYREENGSFMMLWIVPGDLTSVVKSTKWWQPTEWNFKLDQSESTWSFQRANKGEAVKLNIAIAHFLIKEFPVEQEE